MITGLFRLIWALTHPIWWGFWAMMRALRRIGL